MAKEWPGRKETHSASPADLFSGGYRTQLSDDKGRHVDVWGPNLEKSREKAYRKWDEKYR